MPILRLSDNIEFCRYLASSPEIHTMSGRGDDLAGIEFANSRVLESMELTPDDTLLDIGCGDGSLLRTVNGRVCKRIGIVPTAEEKSKLQLAQPNVTFLLGSAESLPLESETVSRIVCNAVFVLLSSDDAVLAALREIVRVAQAEALVFIGEIQEADELFHFCKYRGSSVLGLLTYELRRKGVRALVSSGRGVASALLGRSTLVLNSAKILYSPPEKFISMAKECGLWPIKHFKYQRLRSGKIIESPFRYNYLFRKRNTGA